MSEQRTKLPTNLDDEDPFLSIAEIKLSLRQMLTILLGVLLWYFAIKVTQTLLPISSIFAGILWFWLIVAALFLALYKKDGRPYEEYLTHRLMFLISDRHFILKDKRRKEDEASIDTIDWDDLDD
jgi:hypothetical protein